MYPDRVIGIYVFKLDLPTRGNDEEGRHGQEIMSLTRGRLEIDTVLSSLPKKANSCAIHLMLAAGVESKLPPSAR